MSTSSYYRGKRISLSLGLALALGLFLVAILIYPSSSRAKLEPTQVTQSSKKGRRPLFRPGEVIVRYKSKSMAVHRTGSLRIAARDGQLMSMKVEDFGGDDLVPGLRLARVTEGETLKAVAALREQPDVLYAEPNYILRATVTPNDPHFVASRQLNMSTIGAPTAWNTNTGSTSVVVGVIDQGIDINHQDLQANIWTNPSPGSIAGISGDLHGYNFVNNNGTVFSGTDGESHASHVAGIIGAVGNNNKGVAGVNWSVGLMSLKFLDDEGFGDTLDAIRACTYAKDMRNLWESSSHTKGANIRVLNASFGGAGFSQSFLDAINQLNTAGILFVAAAGNTTDDGTHEPDNDRVPHYPSGFNAPNVISVAAVNQSDALATDFSHFGATTVDLAAPGDPILSTTPHCADPGPPPKLCQPTFTDANGDTYTFFRGTSMSTPHVSGAAALLWSQNPNLTPAQVKSLLLVNGDVRPTLVDKTLTGRRLNIANSFQALAENDTTAPGAVSNFHINSQNGRTLEVGWTASGDDSLNGQAALYQLNFTDGGSGAVIPLKGLVPMPSGKGQIATVTIPYRHTTGTLNLVPFDNVGNVGTAMNLPVGVQQSAGDPYTFATGAAAGLSAGGQKLDGLNSDDAYVETLLPFSFPFFGQNFTEVTISTNGALYFGDPPPIRDDGTADDVPSSSGKLGGYRAIAGLWDDLDLRISSRADAGVFQVNNTNQVIFRYHAKPCNFDGVVCVGGDDVNFEIELNSNGVIRMRYGGGNTQLFPTVGVGGGGHDAYPIGTHTNEENQINLTNAGQVTFTPRAQTVSTVELSQSTINANESTGSVVVTVNRSGDTTSVATVAYATSDASGAASCTDIGSNASSRCDYLTSVGTLKFAAGETSKTVAIPIVNDIFTENPETFTFTLGSNPQGVTLGTPTTATITITDGGAEGTTNPIDNAGFFVRQHYVDFLNREPDMGGLNFWTNEITQCANVQCTEVKRINVSAAFFLSIEFQETGYLVYRIYKASHGNLPGAPVPIAFTNFIRDTQRIGSGVQVNVGDWQNILEANKQAFLLDFVQRQPFLTDYLGLTATQIVDKMNTNAGGNVLSDSERTALIDSFGTTPDDASKRAAVLRAISEDQTFKDAEFNKAFVLMQYFGYLRRSPNDAPDTNYDGFNFWLGKLNQFNGNFVQAEMVKAFITSGEYRSRFAP